MTEVCSIFKYLPGLVLFTLSCFVSTAIINPPSSYSTANFTNIPISKNVTTGDTVIFKCGHQRASSLAFRGFDNSSSCEYFNEFQNGMFLSRTIRCCQPYVFWNITCVASIDDGSPPEVTPPVCLQGPLDSVTNVQRNASNITWNAPSSLDITDVDPDIVYCVEIYIITCGRSYVISDCDVMESRYINDDLQPGYIYEYTITPRSNVRGALNGTNITIIEEFPSVLKVIFYDVTTLLAIINNLGVSSPHFHTFSCESLDGLNDTTLRGKLEDNSVSMSMSCCLSRQRLFNCTILPYDCKDNSSVIGNVLLSTHDIQNISVTSPHPGEVRVTGELIDGSTATGALIIIYSLTNDSDVHYEIITAGPGKTINVSVVGLNGGEYGVSTFALENGGLPFTRVAALPKTVQVTGSEQKGYSLMAIEYTLQSTSTGVCITCTFLESSTTDCVAVVHQRISQLNSSGLMNIESSHKFTRSGDTASGCIEGVNYTNLQVGVAIVGDQRISHDTANQVCGVGCILGIVIFLSVILIVIVALIIEIRRHWKKGGMNLSDSGQTQTRDNELELIHCEPVSTQTNPIPTETSPLVRGNQRQHQDTMALPSMRPIPGDGPRTRAAEGEIEHDDSTASSQLPGSEVVTPAETNTTVPLSTRQLPESQCAKSQQHDEPGSKLTESMEHSNGEMKHSLTSDHPICASQDDSANASSLSCSPQQSLDRVQHSGADTSSSPNPQDLHTDMSISEIVSPIMNSTSRSDPLSLQLTMEEEMNSPNHPADQGSQQHSSTPLTANTHCDHNSKKTQPRKLFKDSAYDTMLDLSGSKDTFTGTAN